MYHSDAVIRQLQAQKILAEKLDSAVSGVIDAVSDQVGKINKGATRLSYYTSCFTDEYMDVCKNQANEDNRFLMGMVQLVKDRNIVFAILKAYIEYKLQNRSPRQIDSIKSNLMRFNIHIAASTLTSTAFAVGVTMYVAAGMNIKFPVAKNIGALAGGAAGALKIYGVVQNAADCAKRLQSMHPGFYHMLYMRRLEMMFFLVEAEFIRAGALTNKYMSEFEVAEVLAKLMGRA